MHKTGTAEMAARVSALERELAASQATVAMLAARVSATERTALDAVKAVAVTERRLAVLLRAMRGGNASLRKVIDAAREGEGRNKQRDIEIARLKTAQAMIDVRIEAEAEDARRGVAGLFQRMETLRAHVKAAG